MTDSNRDPKKPLYIIQDAPSSITGDLIYMLSNVSESAIQIADPECEDMYINDVVIHVDIPNTTDFYGTCHVGIWNLGKYFGINQSQFITRLLEVKLLESHEVSSSKKFQIDDYREMIGVSLSNIVDAMDVEIGKLPDEQAGKLRHRTSILVSASDILARLGHDIYFGKASSGRWFRKIKDAAETVGLDVDFQIFGMKLNYIRLIGNSLIFQMNVRLDNGETVTILIYDNPEYAETVETFGNDSQKKLVVQVTENGVTPEVLAELVRLFKPE